MRFALAAALLVCACGEAASEGSSTEQDIVGGVVDEEDPAVVAINIESTGLAVCSGTLIAPDVVLTAGHCPETGIWVRRGTNVHSLGWFDHLGVKETARHPQYSGEGKAYDVALFRLKDRVKDVAPVKLIDPSAALAASDVGGDVRHVGFGTTGDDWHYVKDIGTGGIKREVTYPITKLDDVFVYSGAPGKQTCVFDSGGPAFRTIDGAEVLVGVVSAGDDCHSDGWDVRLDRADVRSWIDATLQKWQ